MSSCYAETFVNNCLAEVGYQCGPNKENKYAADLDKIDFFTNCGKKQYLDFCSIGLCWAMWRAIVYPNADEDPVSAKWAAHFFMFQSDTCDKAAVVQYLYQYFADNSATTNNPERGDIAIFQKEDGTMYHCGAVTSWDNEHIYITEFNTEGGKVLTHAYNYSDIGRKIKTFCRPRYDGWSESDQVSGPTSSTTKTTTAKVVYENGVAKHVIIDL